jgi:potassium-dependent mechanosensitive channel
MKISLFRCFFTLPPSVTRAWRGVLAFAILFTVAGDALAQQTREIRAQIEAGRLELTQVEAALQRPNLDDKRLADLRSRLEPLAGTIEEIIQREQPRADEIKARIEKLGPAPDLAKGGTESADVAKDRADQQLQWREADETLRLSRALALRIEQVKEAIADRRRKNFTRQILSQGASIASPLLWFDATRAMPGDFRAAQFLMTQWAETIYANLQWFEIIVLTLLAFVAGAGWPRARNWVRSGSFSGEEADSLKSIPRFSKALIALRMIVFNAIAPALLFYLLYWLIQSFGLLPGRADPVMESIVNGLVFIVGMSGLASALFAPHRPGRRLIEMPDSMALAFARMIRLVSVLVAIGKVLEAFQGAIVASLPLSMVTRGTIAVLVALSIARGLKHAFGGATGDENAETRHRPATGFLPVRLAGWIAIITILLSALFGYVALAGFIVEQVVWLTILGLVAVLGFVFIEEILGSGLSASGLLGRRVRETTGLTTSSLDQLSVLGAGLARLLLYIVLTMLALAPWGLDSSNVIGNLRAAFFGFEVGGVTISLSTIAVALALFLVGSLITRAIQRWLDTRYLPRTGLDQGLRNSIRTIFGYVGVIITAMVAFGQLGLSLEKITIVAGALSVGIGFGLQSIVNNFVSGLILLWERPIRVGDWIVVGEEQGTVKRINVRATEIETFDRASLIIPNSEFISGRVKNWMHADRTGRIIIPINVDYQADPEAVQALLKDAALAHREVMSEPAPIVIFKNLGESGLDFELRCFVDVDAMGATRSDLLFDIFRRLREAKIDVPYPTRRLEITNLHAGTDVAALLAAEGPASPRQEPQGKRKS